MSIARSSFPTSPVPAANWQFGCYNSGTNREKLASVLWHNILRKASHRLQIRSLGKRCDKVLTTNSESFLNSVLMHSPVILGVLLREGCNACERDLDRSIMPLRLVQNDPFRFLRIAFPER